MDDGQLDTTVFVAIIQKQKISNNVNKTAPSLPKLGDRILYYVVLCYIVI